MAYQPKTKSNFVRGDSGEAQVIFSKDHKKVQTILHIKQGEETVEKKLIFDRENTPENLRPGKWMISVSGQGDKIMGFRPVIGNFVVTTASFASAEHEEPKPKTKDVSFEKGGKKQEYSYEYFTVLLNILEPEKYKDIEIPYTLRYHFEQDTYEGKEVVAYSKGGSKYTDYLKEYLNIAGAWDLGPLPYKDNVLPDLQKRILHADKKFQVTMKDGWVVPGSLIPFDEPEESEVPFDVDDAATTSTPAPSFDTTDEIDFEPEE